MRALVTGGGGFLGRYIVEQLIDRGDSVRIFARGSYPELVEIGAELIRGDLQDAQAVSLACKNIDIVFHVGAKAGFWGNWDAYYGINVLGTDNILVACREQKVANLVYTSSPSVIFSNESQENINESTPYPEHYESHYPHTKAIAERAVLKANNQDLLTVSLRPHLIFGPRDTQILPRVLSRARKGRIIQVGNGTNKVDLSYVEDVARAHLLAADALMPGSPVAGSVYFISQDEPVTLWPWINDLLSRLNIPQIKRRIPLSLARVIGGILEFTYKTFQLKGEPQLTRFLASELAMSHYYDISRAKQDLNFTPYYSMEEAVQKTVHYFQKNPV
jgi:nucleoside-diphosphate-sugar epimerase